MNDVKTTLGIVLGCVALVGVAIFGLSKMSTTGGLSIEVSKLVQGARFVKENGETKVTVVEFADMACPGCASASEQIKSLREMSGVKLVYRHFPLNIHKNGVIGARSVEAARIMGKGWEMMDKVYQNQNDWAYSDKAEEKLITYAKEVGLDEKQFVDNLKSEEVINGVKLDQSLADELKLDGTPSIFVDGELISSEFVIAKVNEILNAK